ncbi:MAG: hypothetical protein OER95_09280 [Acidimicrobiia bacterium]|nr:hypothetical protein [Acidimicrobiia bacterium]
MWVAVGVLLVVAVIQQQSTEAAAPSVKTEVIAPTPSSTSAARGPASSTSSTMDGRAQGSIAEGAETLNVRSTPVRTGDGRQPAWFETGPTSDLAGPTADWGAHGAVCPAETFLVYGARTDPRKYEYVVCSTPDGRLSYHGIEVDSGAEIRLPACLNDAGHYVAVASADYRYEVVDGRSGTRTRRSVADGRSRITLYRSATEIDWRFSVHSEWGMQNLPPDFAKC